ncbi:efflux RND transporter periplasmic adaptor subunit [Pontitalea aquivivens]|uniref:efflux RND transporter periplasmic adaptor subunit n=1 Tax=Pontitalea aquivivens TaxID=3388663 RepID=UPI003970EE01
MPDRPPRKFTAPRLIAPLLGVVTLAGLAVWALWPKPEPVDLAAVTLAPMEVTVEAEGVTRVRDPYLVTAPLTGAALRMPVQVGDPVTRGQTVVAVIRPAEPAFLDARARAAAEAAVTEAQAALRLAEVNLSHAQADLDYAEAELRRNLALSERGIIASRTLEAAAQARDTAAAALQAARSELDLNRATLARMQAQLVAPAPAGPDAGPGDCCVQISAPHSGRVLTVADPSARLVQAGEPLLTIGDLQDLEIEVDLLSADAVKVAPGALAHIERWGGPDPLQAQVRRIEPAAFTRVSALGIEEQRVRLKLDILSPPEARAGLGDGYRVFVRVVIWSSPQALQVPQGALFRHEGGWAVFRETNGRAALVPVTIGQIQADRAEVLSGLSEGDRVVAYPGNRITDGARIAPRPNAP